MSESNDIEKQTSLIIKVITNVMRPLVKLLIYRGVTFPMFSEILKRLYVDVAAKDFKLSEDKENTDSRITLLTKVHRKDIRRLRDETVEFDPEIKKTSLGAQIIAKWLAANEYIDNQGSPLKLYKLASKANGKPNFEKLVNSINNDIRPGGVLDELISQNVIVEDNDGLISLNEKAFVPKENFTELIGHFNRNLHDHMAAAVHNIAQSENDSSKKYLERAVYYKGLTAASIEKLEALIEKDGMESLISINKAAYDQAEQDQLNGNADQRMTFGIYYYSEKDEE